VTTEPEDKTLVKIAIVFGVLEKLGFSQSRIEECVKRSKTLDLDDVFDWVSPGLFLVARSYLKQSMAVGSSLLKRRTSFRRFVYFVKHYPRKFA
jgi:hypothetical protein